MTEMAKGSVTHQRLIALLSQEGANFRVVTHEAVGKCEAVSEIRGTALGQGAKALVCKVKGTNTFQIGRFEFGFLLGRRTCYR